MRSDDGTLSPTTALGAWNETLIHAMSLVGRNITDSVNWGKYMTEVGFEDVTEKLVYVPVNPWPKGRKNKVLGEMSQRNLYEGLGAMGQAAFMRILGWEKEKCDAFIEEARRDLVNPGCHAYCVVYFCYGRKPGRKAEPEISV